MYKTFTFRSLFHFAQSIEEHIQRFEDRFLRKGKKFEAIRRNKRRWKKEGIRIRCGVKNVVLSGQWIERRVRMSGEEKRKVKV